MSCKLSGSFHVSPTSPFTATWAGQWSLEGSPISSKFSYTSAPNGPTVQLSHASGKKYHFPTLFNGTFDIQTPATADPPSPARIVSTQENEVSFEYKLLRGANDPNIGQFVVSASGQNIYGHFEMQGRLDLQDQHGTLQLSGGSCQHGWSSVRPHRIRDSGAPESAAISLPYVVARCIHKVNHLVLFLF